MTSIAVITFSVDRPKLLFNCINSVRCQLGDFQIQHYIFFPKHSKVRTYCKSDSSLQLIEYDDFNDNHLARKMALLRQMALDYIEEDFLCFLDDDNEFSNIHILSLFNLIQLHSLEAAHSIRYLVYSDGSLYSGDFFPWHPDSIRATEIYKWCIHNRVLRVGSPIIYDGVVISDDPNNFACVDMNEWLFRTEIIQKIGFDTKFTKFDEQNMVGEDDKLLSRILEEGVNFTSSYLPTVKYSLGGFSNMKSTEI